MAASIRAFAFAIILASSSAALAVDLGGNCCADLEQRIAELEATTARKGNRKISLTVNGWIAARKNAKALIGINPTVHANADNNARLLGLAIANVIGGVTGGAGTGPAAGSSAPMNLGAAGDDTPPVMFASPPNGQSGAWATAFGATATFDAGSTGRGADADFAGGLAGAQWRVAHDLLLGAFAGAAWSDVDPNAANETLESRYALGGVYGRYTTGALFVDAITTVGWSNSDNAVDVLTNIGVPSLQRASGDFDGLFIVPSLEVGTSIPLSYGAELIPSVTVRYLWQHYDGYSLQAQTVNIGFGSRDLHGLEERAQLELRQSLTPGFAISLAGGAVFYQRLSDGDVAATFLGITAVDNPGAETSEAGAFIQSGFRLDLTPDTAVYGNAEYLDTGEFESATGNLGLSVHF